MLFNKMRIDDLRRLLLILLSTGSMFLGSHCHCEDLEGRKHFSEALFEATFVVGGALGGYGTGFAISCDTNGAFLVTARHVFDSIKGDTAIIYYRIRLTYGSYSVKPHKIAIRHNGRNLYCVHPDSLVDVAAIQLTVPRDSLLMQQLLPFHRSLLATEDDMKKYWVHPGDEVFFLGYPLGITSPTGLFPILRSGFIASYPFIPLLKNPFVYLDGPVFEGNSGGPVYFELTASSWNGRAVNQNGLILGLVSFTVNPEAAMKIDTVKKQRDVQIAGFVNSAYILQVLDSLGCR
jgi:hypothetical protein